MSDLKREPWIVRSLQAPASGSAPGQVELEGLSFTRPVCSTALLTLPVLNGRTRAGGASDDGSTGGWSAGAGRKTGRFEGLLSTSGSALAVAVPGPGAAFDDLGLPGPMPVEIARFPPTRFIDDDGGLIEGSWRGEAAGPGEASLPAAMGGPEDGDAVTPAARVENEPSVRGHEEFWMGLRWLL